MKLQMFIKMNIWKASKQGAGASKIGSEGLGSLLSKLVTASLG